MDKNPIPKWQTIKSDYIIRRPWLTARRDHIKHPDGRIVDEYYVLEYPSWINVIAIDENGDFIMVEQYRHGLDDVFIELCAGVVEDGEEPLDAAKRELLEETDYTGGKWSLLNKISPNPTACTNYAYCYLAEGVEKTNTQHLDESEDIAVRIFTETEVLQLLHDDKIKQALMATPLWHYFAIKRLNDGH